jgi:Uma2 family endonuclease
MTDLLIQPENDAVPRNAYVADDPIDFERWLTLTQDLDTELVKGVMLVKMAAKYPHEWIFMWLASILRQFTGNLGLGVVLGSRTAVKIDRHDGRLPDILFVRADNTAIIRTDAIYGAPDLVIEIVSTYDRRADLISLETDYCAVGVPEIVFIDPQKKQVRLVRKTEAGEYQNTVLTTGRLELRCVPGFWIEVDWIFAQTPPDAFDVTSKLLQQAKSDSG